ncbi:MAG: wax ester/triacylglycerol synthase family O-acyltransferase [Sandaracinaceae bacterium]|nr:wax ester/triacylglycerol synthase family O-acyltransferase [Sandaracinaceae bacterium]
MHRLSPLDMGFLLAETRETPMHVGGLYLFTLPEGADETEFLGELREILRSPTEWRRPFGHNIRLNPLVAAAYWVPDEHLDVDYHVRHSALPKPGRYRELFRLASRLHQSLLDRHRPLWETHLIEGLQDRQFALYSKVHHAAIDGVSGVRIAQSMLSTDPTERREHSPFSLAAYEQSKADRPPREPPTEREMKAVAEVLRESFGVSRSLFSSLRTYARAWLQPDADKLMTAWTTTPVTSFSTKITGARRFVAQSYSLPRVRAVGKALDGTINDVVLAMCGGALRRYLLSRDELPEAPLTAMTPVSLRTDTDQNLGNAVGALTANLATHIADPQARFEATKASMTAGKSLLTGMTPKEIELFTQLTQVPPLMIGMLGLGDRFPPYSTVISNVPGPRERSYWNGASLDGMYPMSAIYHGFALNFTLLSNADQLDFGVIACRESVPSCQRIIDHLEDSLAELEAVAGI